jgi:hypothetical protein
MRFWEYKARVEAAVAARPHLIPVFTSALFIPERIREYNPSLYVCYNAIRHLQKVRGEKPQAPPPGIALRYGGWFEVHSLDKPNDGRSLIWVNPYGELDCRLLRHVWENDIRVHGRKAVYAVFERNEEAEKRAQRRFKNINEALARELYRPFANAAWDGKTQFGYTKETLAQ